MRTPFGLFVDDDLAFLHQQGGGVCLTPGLSGLSSPYEPPAARRGLVCPHAIDVDADDAAADVDTAPDLIRVLAPIPDGGAYWAPESELPLVKLAMNLCSPTIGVFFPVWASDMQRLVAHLDTTNIAPLILASYEAKHLKAISKLLEVPRSRTIILCGPYRPPGVQEVGGGVFDPNTDWRAMGAQMLKHHVHDIVEKART